MTWTYDVTRDVLTVTYGRQDRSPSRTVRAGEALLYLDEKGAAIRAELLRAGIRHQVHEFTSLQESDTDDWVDMTRAAERLGVKPYALREEILSGGMPALKTGQSWRLRQAVLDVYREILAVRRAARLPGDRIS
jgi:excisionase family DNA binding protein